VWVGHVGHTIIRKILLYSLCMLQKLSSENVEEMNNTHAKLNELGKDDS
jgi:hypothetical protein